MTSRRPHVALPFSGKFDERTGRALCCFCGTPVSGRRIRWCSDTCVERYEVAKGSQRACRRVVWRRDRGVCKGCGVNVNKRRRSIMDRHGYIPKHLRAQTKWEADHVIPIIEGGPHTPENLRTLCVPCHREATAALRKRLAARKTVRP